MSRTGNEVKYQQKEFFEPNCGASLNTKNYKQFREALVMLEMFLDPNTL